MSRLFYHVMQDNAGNLLFDVSGTMRVAGSGTLATIYGDEELTVVLPNPMTNHPSFGSFKCFLGAGAYDFYMAKSGYTFETLTGVQGHGTMALQNANAVTITGGSANGLTEVGIGVADAAYPLDVAGNVRVTGNVGIQTAPAGDAQLHIAQRRDLNHHAIQITAIGNDGNGLAALFRNTASAQVGSIYCTSTTTAFNTSSDARLKYAVQALGNALSTIQALKPVSFKWKADDTEGHGFLASEVQGVIPEAVTGEANAVDDAGQIVPQQMDQSKLVPWLTAALQETIAQVQALTARVANLEQQLVVS